MTIDFACPACGAPIYAPEEVAGKTGKCSTCHARLSVPLRNADEVPQVPMRSSWSTPPERLIPPPVNVDHSAIPMGVPLPPDWQATPPPLTMEPSLTELYSVANPSRNDPGRSNLDDRARRVVRRYRDAYAEARVIIQVGTIVKTAAIFLAIGIFAGILLMANYASYNNEVSGEAVVAGLVISCPIGFSIFWAGVLICSTGQLLLASLDSAVHGSPFLDDEGKAEAMGLNRANQSSEIDGVAAVFTAAVRPTQRNF